MELAERCHTEGCEHLASVVGYAVALEAIIGSLPGGPVVNGVRMSNEAGLADLRRRFDVAALVVAADHPEIVGGHN